MPTLTQVNHRPSGNHGITRYATELRQHIPYQQVIFAPASTPSWLDWLIILPLKVILSKHTDVFHITFPQGGLCCLAAKLRHNPLVVTTIEDINPVLFNRNHPLKPILRCIQHFSDANIFISKMVMDDWTEFTHSVVDDTISTLRNCIVIPCGIGEQFRPLPDIIAARNNPHEPFRVGYVGNFKPHKNVQLLQHAFTLFAAQKGSTNVELSLIGDGASSQSDLSIPPARTFDGVTDDMLPEAYNSFDVFVFPSIHEGFGLPILEAMACGIPVIINSKGHIPEETAKYCFKCSDAKEMAECLSFVEHWRYVDGEREKKYAQNFTWKDTAEKTVAFINTMYENSSLYKPLHPAPTLNPKQAYLKSQPHKGSI